MSAAPGAVAAARTELREADDATSVAACYPLMRQLRPHLASAEEFVERWQRQRPESYRILAAWDGERPLALAGYRFQENLLRGRYLYVDDLVTSASERGGGYGARLIAHLAELARAQGCSALTLSAAMDNALGHRFYFRNGLLMKSVGFSMALA
jgi:GNAT superfamily N-acetyltransferase